MGFSTQSFSNLLSTCSTFWTQVTTNVPPESLTINTQRILKILVEQSADFAISTLKARATAARLVECTTFIKAQTALMHSATRCFLLALASSTCIIILSSYKNEYAQNENQQVALSWVTKGLAIAALFLFFIGLRKVHDFSTLGRELLSKIAKTSPPVEEEISQIMKMRDVFLVEGLYKTV